MAYNPLQVPLMKLGRMIITLKPVLIDAIGTEALEFIDGNFEKQSWRGEFDEPWAKRKKEKKGGKRGRKILFDEGHLRYSMKKTDHANETEIHTDDVKAQIHNEGGDIQIKGRQAMLSFRRTSSKKGAKLLFTSPRKKYKVVAQAKVNIGPYTIHMPKRQFAGPSPVLDRMCEKAALKIIIANIPD